jgi:predicted nucleotidyltransferase
MTIADAIFSPSQRKLYRWLFGQPERSYHLNELLRLTGLGSASLQRELTALTKAGLLTAARIGNQRMFRANSGSPIFYELTTIVQKTLGIDALVRNALSQLNGRIKSAWLYGSVAKGTDGAHSEIDLMIVGNDLSLSEVLEVVIPIESIIGNKINPTLFTVSEFATRLTEPDSFVNRVLANKLVPLIDRRQ